MRDDAEQPIVVLGKEGTKGIEPQRHQHAIADFFGFAFVVRLCAGVAGGGLVIAADPARQ